MSKQQAKDIFKGGSTTWEEKTMHEYTDIVYGDIDKSSLYIIYGNDVHDHGTFSFTSGRTQYAQIYNRKTQTQKGKGLSRGNTSVTVNKTGHYLVSLELQIMSNTVPQTLIGAQIYTNDSHLNPNNPTSYLINDKGGFNSLKVEGILACEKGDIIQFGLITGGNQEIRVAGYTSMTITEI